jgi:hypothetical protein
MTLWADAICINQEDLQERKQQLGLMGSIFSNAKYVIAWFGSDDGDAEEVFALICETNNRFMEHKERVGFDKVPEVQPEDLVHYDDVNGHRFLKCFTANGSTVAG